MNKKLKLCPKCRHEALIIKSKGKVTAFSVKCSNCNNKTIWYAAEAEAVSAWNRVSEPEPEDPDKPKRCPFCGGPARIHHVAAHASTSRDYYVMCDKCLTSGNNYPTESKAVEAWNRRINE